MSDGKPYVIRPAEERDHAAIAALYTRVHPDDPLTVEVLVWLLGRAIPDRPHPFLVAEMGPQVVGWGLLRGLPNLAPAFLILEVDPDRRRMGIGSGLLDAVLSASPGESEIVVEVSAASAESLAFVRHRGFVEEARRFESVLELGPFDPRPFDGVRARLEAEGYRFSSFDQEDSEDLRRGLHRLSEEAAQDVPTPEPVLPTSYEVWARDWLDAPHAIPATFALVFLGPDPVGFSYVISQSEGIGYMWMTAVAREHRGRGIGLAVKVHALRAAQARGLREVSTNNDPGNAPMLAINHRLGFVDRPAVVEFKKSRSGAHKQSSR
jgi:ribosomal protein S18 acetylase RimI-like enzyme